MSSIGGNKRVAYYIEGTRLLLFDYKITAPEFFHANL
jgi:hypothetical protein